MTALQTASKNPAPIWITLVLLLFLPTILFTGCNTQKSTTNGLSRFHIQDETFLNYFEDDGLTHNEFNRISYFKSHNGRMFFGAFLEAFGTRPSDVRE